MKGSGVSFFFWKKIVHIPVLKRVQNRYEKLKKIDKIVT